MHTASQLPFDSMSGTWRPSMPAPRRIVIIGGGFAGVGLARALHRKAPPDWQVVVFSRENHLIFTPLLAEEVAGGGGPRAVLVVRRLARDH